MKQKDNNFAKRIRDSIKVIDSKAQVIIFGSRARGDAKKESDWDILILTDYPVSTKIERSFRNNLFDLEIETGEVFVELFDWRQKGDYGDFYDFDKEKTMPLFKPVETLIEELKH